MGGTYGYHKTCWEPRGNHCVNVRLTFWEVEQLKEMVHGVTSGVIEFEDFAPRDAKEQRKLEWLERKLTCKLACERVPKR